MKTIISLAALLLVLIQVYNCQGSVYCNRCVGCRRGWHAYRNKCYMLSQDQLTFDEARNACNKKNAKMVRIHGSREQAFLSTLLDAYDDSNCGTKMECSFWIGLYSRSQTDDFRFRWLGGGGKVRDMTFSQWGAGSPWQGGTPRGNPKNACAFMRIGTNDLAASTCDFSRNYFCVQDKTTLRSYEMLE